MLTSWPCSSRRRSPSRRCQHLDSRILQRARDGRLEPAARLNLDHEAGQLRAVPPRAGLAERDHDGDGGEERQPDSAQRTACPASVPDAVIQRGAERGRHPHGCHGERRPLRRMPPAALHSELLNHRQNDQREGRPGDERRADEQAPVRLGAVDEAAEHALVTDQTSRRASAAQSPRGQRPAPPPAAPRYAADRKAVRPTARPRARTRVWGRPARRCRRRSTSPGSAPMRTSRCRPGPGPTTVGPYPLDEQQRPLR